MLFDSSDYQLLDFGGGRKLERFGDYTLDRPAPAAGNSIRHAAKGWSAANARFDIQAERRGEAGRGLWTPRGALPDEWPIRFGPLTFELKPTRFGHLGIFPEQAGNWSWIAQRVANHKSLGRTLKILNLFAYTGGSTLAAALAGGQIVHVDSSRAAVAWARRNAALSGLESAPIRWIVEDARRFVERELARGNRYDALILDPPSYGHGPKGQVWRLDIDLPQLLESCAALLTERPAFALLTCHTPTVSPADAGRLLAAAFQNHGEPQCSAGELTIVSAADQRLPCGIVARYGEEN